MTVLGLGHLGGAVAAELVRQGFRVLGWSRSPKAVTGVECHAGLDQLPNVLAQTDILVALLPLTRDTENLIDATRLAMLPRGARFVSLGRGRVVDEDALVAALESGHLSEATLDVFRTEPLPPDHRLWRLPQVLITPHLASVAAPRSSAPQVVENIRRLRAGQPLLNIVEPERGY